jgi:hypothetical protein
LSCSVLVEGGQPQAESLVIRIKLVDLAAEQLDLGIHDIRQALGAGAASGRILGKVLPRAAGVWRYACLSGWRNGRPRALS